MRIKTVNIIYYLLIAILLIDCRLFYFRRINPIFGLMLLFVTLAFVALSDNKTKKKTLSETPFLRRICFLTVCIFGIVLVFSKLTYTNQSFMQTFGGESLQYSLLMTLLIYPLMKISQNKQGVKWLFSVMNAFAIVLYVVLLLQFIIHIRTGRVFLQAVSASLELPLLNGTIRASLAWFGNFMIVYNFYQFYRSDRLSNRQQLFHMVIFALGLVDCIVVSRIRGFTWIVSVCLIYIGFSHRNNKVGFLKKTIIVIGILAGIFGTDILPSFFDSLSATSARGYSTTARLYAIEYYWKIFLQKPLFGIGFADGSVYSRLVHGDGRAYYSDVGIFGQLARLGLMVIPLYIYPLVRSFSVILKTKKSTTIQDYPLYFSFALFVALSSFTVMVFSHALIILWPVYLTIVEFIGWAATHNCYINEP